MVRDDQLSLFDDPLKKFVEQPHILLFSLVPIRNADCFVSAGLSIKELGGNVGGKNPDHES